MPASSRLDVAVGGPGNDSAKRLRIGGVAETPNIFDLFLGKLKRLWNIDVGGKEFYARRIRRFIGGSELGGFWYGLF